MGIPYRELQMRISAPDFALYMAYDHIDPFSEQRADLRSAIIACVMANAFAAKGKKFKVSEFMAVYSEPKNKMTDDQLFQQMMSITIAAKGTVINGNNSNS